MPRRKTTTAELDDAELSGLDGLDQDPEPTATRTRTRRTPAKAPAKAAGNRGKVPARNAGGRIMSKAAMMTQVRNEVGMYLDLMAAGWEIRDPICAQAATPDRIATIADRLTNMIARNDSLLVMATKTGIIGDVVALLSAALPIAKEVWRAHGPGGLGHASPEEIAADYANQYPAASLAR